MRFKVTETTIFEYDVRADAYPKGSTIEQMMEIDRLNFDEDPEMMHEMGGTCVVIIEEVK